MGAVSSFSQVLVANMSILNFKLIHKNFMNELIEIIQKYKDSYFI
jgi:hypothetical protein